MEKIGVADFSPTKSFFVEMLTRDITLEDAILDLLDNCLDGVLRQTSNKHEYEGFFAEIELSKEKFTIRDNCGGISSDSWEYAFRMGNPNLGKADKLETVGIYGIGMKRAIFKMGKHGFIRSQFNDSSAFEVQIDDAWLKDDDDWDIDINSVLPLDQNGTLIEVNKLSNVVSKKFDDKAFVNKFRALIEQTYSYIIEKGFVVKVNGEKINCNPLAIKFDKNQGIAPYIYEAVIDNVKVDIIVGFYRGTPTEEETIKHLEGETSRQSGEAGWTVICNDRVVLYRDKTEVTGWGSRPVPRYHTQFIAIAGIVHLRSNDPSKLPLTTTKRGVDLSSEIYLHIREMMKEGMKIFTDYTNRWKNEHLQAGKEIIESSQSTVTLDTLEEYKKEITSWKKVKNKDNEKRFKPELPTPKILSSKRRITYVKPLDEIELVSEYLYGESDVKPNEVGEACFDKVLAEIKDNEH